MKTTRRFFPVLLIGTIFLLCGYPFNVSAQETEKIPVGKNKPAYDLYMAARALEKGNEGKAWQLTNQKLRLLKNKWHKFDVKYVVWVLDQMRKQERYGEALDFSEIILHQEDKLENKAYARVQVAKGDILQGQENYSEARQVYQDVLGESNLKDTDVYRKAQFHLVDLLLRNDELSKAEEKIQKLLGTGDLEVQADAYYYYARLAYLKEDYEAAKERLDEVFSIRSDHVKARLLEGRLKLNLPRGLVDPQVAVGDPELQAVVVPGDPLRLKLRDANLAVAQGGDAVPVQIVTSKGKDKEIVNLLPSSIDETLFRAKVDTTTDKVKQQNGRLELQGDDIVQYMIAPDFQKAHDLSYKPKNLKVKSEGELEVSAAQILTQEEISELRKQKDLDEEETQRLGRIDKTLRPGNKMYVQVTDFDQHVSEEKDAVQVDIETSAGDKLQDVQVEEIGKYRGVFRKALDTSLPAPRAYASSSGGQNTPAVAINSSKSAVWRNRKEAGFPQWFEVDTMSSHNVKKIVIATKQAQKINEFKILGRLAEEYYPLASHPEKNVKGGLKTVTRRGKPSRLRRGESLDEMKGYLREGVRSGQVERGRSEEFVFDRENLSFNTGKGWLTTRMTGKFYLPESKILEVKFLQEAVKGLRGYLTIDGKEQLGGPLSDNMFLNDRQLISLKAGVHSIGMYMVHKNPDSRIVPGFRKSEGSFAPIPSAWFSVKKHAQLKKALTPPGNISIEKNRITVNFSEPERLRQIRSVFAKVKGNQVGITKFAVLNGEGENILPVTEDFSAQKTNDSLEIAPGDRVNVSYRDEQRLDPHEPIKEAALEAAFENGTIRTAYRKTRTYNENERDVFLSARRCKIGDTLTVIVRDRDLDISHEADEVEVRAKTDSGVTRTFTAKEQDSNRRRRGIHSGNFRASVSFVRKGENGGTNGQKNAIPLEKGETVTVTYLDKDNTDPGIPVRREWALSEAGKSDARIKALRGYTRLMEDTSAEAKAKKRNIQRTTRRNLEDIKIYKYQPFAAYPDYLRNISDKKQRPIQLEPIQNSVRAPLLFQVYCPSKALHQASSMKATVVSKAELKAAEEQGRSPEKVEVPLHIFNISNLAQYKGTEVNVQAVERHTSAQMLEEGIFAGIVRLQLGAHGDSKENTITEAAAERMDLGGTANKIQIDGETIPTVLVQGNDTVQIRVENPKTGEAVTKEVTLSSKAQLELYDRSYTYHKEDIYLGENFYLRLSDADQDRTDTPDKLQVNATVYKEEALEQERQQAKITLTETGDHTGVFTASVKPRYAGEESKSGEAEDNGKLQVKFGDFVRFQYRDENTIGTEDSNNLSIVGNIHFGANMKLAQFSKNFPNNEVAMKSYFLMTESLLEMAKSYRKFDQGEMADEKIKEAEHFLKVALRDYPQSERADQGYFLLGNLAQKLENPQKAIERYTTLISRWPESTYAAKAQFQKARCLEKVGRPRKATEEYVRLTYLYPDSSKVGEATARLGNYFYRNKKYGVAAEIFHKFQSRHPDHELAPKALVLAGQSYMKNEKFEKAAKAFGEVDSEYKDRADLRAQALYWLGASYEKSNEHAKAYKSFKQLTWDYPQTKWAKIARGKLTEEEYQEMDSQ